MPAYYIVPWSLVAFSIILIGVIYWGALVEERRNGRTGR